MPDSTTPADGSSPLARGTLLHAGLDDAGGRFIPARAGNTPKNAGIVATAPVHPRSRGEHSGRSAPTIGYSGSSPLARGTRHAGMVQGSRRRFIPARAGNTCSSRPLARPPPVHPRSRGEHASKLAAAVAQTGSSPLARGTRETASPEPRKLRFIPARAGNTTDGTCPWSCRPVHPRSRGEHDNSRFTPATRTGSSPLARGTRPPSPLAREASRFIPARAGNTLLLREVCARTAVHPRSRGEHRGGDTECVSTTGSSPLARGTPEPGSGPAGLRRFIPARAGNTPGACARPASAPVHPRSRGEHEILAGTPDEGDRFIPARAGNTSS